MTPEEDEAFRRAVDGDGTPIASWSIGVPMDPSAGVVEPLPALPGVPFQYAGAGSVIVGPTGGGRSTLLEVCLYDAGRAGLRAAYLGSEIGHDEFNSRAADIANRRGDTIDQGLRTELASVRYLDLASVIVAAWQDPEKWRTSIVASYDVLAVDPLSAVASALDLDFDKSNADFVKFYDRLILPITAAGVTVELVDNVGHAEEARRRAKGVSAKGDRADLTFSCKHSTNPPGLLIRAHKVRSVRAPFQRDHEWIFDRETLRIKDRGAGHTEPDAAFRPTGQMQRVSELLEATPRLSSNAICTAVKGRREYVLLAIQLLEADGHIDADHQSQTPYREPTGSSGSPVVPDRFPEPPGEGGSTGSPSLREGTSTGTTHRHQNGTARQPPVPVPLEAAQ